MNPGRLNKRITLQRLKTVKVNGIATKQWEDVATVWASIEPLRGREYFAATAVNAEVTTRVKIRYRSGVTADMRGLYGSRVFDIKSPPIDPEERHEELHLMCSEEGLNG